jgi:hypothetical protein
MAEFLAGEYLERLFRPGDERAGHLARLVDIHAARSVDQREFFSFLFGVLLEFFLLEGDLVLVHVALRTHRDVFPGSHGEGAGQQPGNAGDEYRAGRGAGTRDAHDQRRIGNEAVIDAKHRGAQIAAGYATVALSHLRQRGRHGMPGCRAARIDRHAPQFHGGEHVPRGLGTEALDERCDDPGAQRRAE